MHLMRGEVWLPEDPTHGRMVRMVAWSACTKTGCSALCRLNFQYNSLSRMPNSSVLYAGYRVTASCNIQLK